MNDAFTKSLLESHGDEVARKLSERTELTPEQSLAALSALSPVVLSSLKRQQEKVGASGIEELLAQAGITENQADDLDDVFEKGLAGHSSQTRAVLGEGTQEQTAMALSKKLNIGGSLAKKLLPMLAPVILGMLVKKGKSKSSSQSSGSGGLAGGIGSILDRDGDGSILDDIAGMVLGGGAASAGGSKGGIFKWLLSLIFGRK